MAQVFYSHAHSLSPPCAYFVILYKIRCICMWRIKPLDLVSQIQFCLTLRCAREKFLMKFHVTAPRDTFTCFFTNYIGINAPCKNASCKKKFFKKSQQSDESQQSMFLKVWTGKPSRNFFPRPSRLWDTSRSGVWLKSLVRHVQN